MTTRDPEAAGFIERELDAELAKLRRSGALPPSRERMLNDLSSELTPDLGNEPFENRLARVEASSYLDLAVPTASRKPGLSLIKRGLKAGMHWYLNYLVQQLNNFSYELIGLLEGVDARIEALERAGGPRSAPALPPRVSFDDPDLVTDHLVSLVAGEHPSAPVLVTEPARGDALLRLSRQIDPDLVYGVTSDPEEADRLSAAGLDARLSATSRHLERLAPQSHAAIVLRGAEIELTPSFVKEAILELAYAALSPGGTLAILHHEPSALERSGTLRAWAAVEGSPWPAGAWTAVCQRSGWKAATRRLSIDTYCTTVTA